MRQPRVWIGVAVSALFLVLLLRREDPQALGAQLAAVSGRWPLLPLAVAVELVALWVRGLRWRLILDSTVRISTFEAFALLMIGYAANDVLPMRAGEVVRAHLLYTSHGTSRLAGIGTIAVERIFDGLILVLFLAGTIAVAGGNNTLRGLAALMAVIFAGATLVLALLALWPGFVALCVRMLGVLPAGIRPRAREWLASFLAGLGALRNGRAWASVTAMSLVSWSLEAAAFWTVGHAFGLTLAPGLYLAVCGAATLAIAAPSTAGGIGPFEFFASEVVVAFGGSHAAATTYALVLHALLLAPVVVLGLLLLWRQHLGLGSMMRAAQSAPEGAVE